MRKPPQRDPHTASKFGEERRNKTELMKLIIVFRPSVPLPLPSRQLPLHEGQRLQRHSQKACGGARGRAVAPVWSSLMRGCRPHAARGRDGPRRPALRGHASAALAELSRGVIISGSGRTVRSGRRRPVACAWVGVG